jgi:hypothetical protein
MSKKRLSRPSIARLRLTPIFNAFIGQKQMATEDLGILFFHIFCEERFWQPE